MKRILIMAAALMVAASAYAQIGKIGGVTTSATTLSEAYSDILEAENVNQYHIGLVSKHVLPFGFVLQPAVVYDVKGASLKSNIEAGSAGEFNIASFDAKTGYAEFQLQLQWGVTIAEQVLRVYALAEPSVSYAVHASTKSGNFIAEMISKDEPQWTDITEWDGINRLQYGVGLGGGIEIFDDIQLSARYYWDFGRLFNDEGKISDLNVKEYASLMKDSRCSGIKVSLAFLF